MTSVEDRDVQDEIRMLLDVWEQEQENSSWDPDPTLTRIAEILDAATNNFITNNPDPLDDRHPIKSLPHCNLGHLLKIIFKVDDFINKLVISYLLAKENTKRNVLAARVLIGILPGLDTNVILSDADSLVLQLFRWAESSESRELRAYSMSLLGAAMDAEQAHQYRSNNVRLIPIALQRLRDLYAEMIDSYRKQDEELLKNNPMHGATNFSKLIQVDDTGAEEGAKATRSDEAVTGEAKDAINGVQSADRNQRRESNKRRRSEPLPRESNKRLKLNNGISINIEETEGNATVPERVPVYQPIRVTRPNNGLLSPSGSTSELQGFSNNSWKNTMHPIVVGAHRLYPLSIEMEQRLILQYLIPTCEYQDNLSIVLESRALDVVLNYLSLNSSRDIRLLFDALRYTSSLLVHRKFAWEFIAANGVEKLFRVNRYSMASTAVGTCLYYLAYSTDIMEKVCHLSDSILNEMVDYAIWLLDHSHESGRASASMFFTYAIQFKPILERFDLHDGLRRVYNYISTLVILQEDSLNEELNDEYFAQTALTIKNAINTLKAYLSTHIYIKIEQIKRSHVGKSATERLLVPLNFPSGSRSHFKAISMDAETETACINFLVQSQCLLMFHYHNWKAIDDMRNLGIFRLFIDILSNADWNSTARPETIRLILDFFRLASVSPKVQLDLCETHVVRNVSIQGLALILELIEGDVFSEPGIQKAALEILINCVCGPMDKNVGGIHYRINNLDPEYLADDSSNSKLPLSRKNSQAELLNASRSSEKVFLDGNAILRITWQCAKKNNAIMTLSTLLHVKEPPTDADMLRELACRALNGIARHEPVCQILSKLPLITSNELNALMQEPVLLEKRQEHSKFCEQARQLISRVAGAEIVQDLPRDMMTQEKLWKANVVKNTKIIYNEKELLQLIYQHLNDIGFKKTARQLQEEAELPRLPASRIPSTPSSLPTPPSRNASLLEDSTKPSVTEISKPRALNTPKNKLLANVSSASTPKRAPASTRTASSSVQAANKISDEFTLQVKPYKSLNEIVTEYFRKQHAACRNPIATCPPFSLFYPHKCPEPSVSYATAPNLVSRVLSSSIPPFQCTQEMLRQANRRLIFSRFRHWKSFYEDSETFTSCCFSDKNISETFQNNNEYIILGNYTGELLWFNLRSGQLESTTSCHQSAITSIQQTKHSSTLMLTSSAFVRPYSALWRIGDEQSLIKEFSDETFVDFGNHSLQQLIGTQTVKATIFDTETCIPIVQLYDESVANHYTRNRACFDPYDELVLNDGVLFDPRIGSKGSVVHKFDKLNPDISGIFHPNGSEVIINSEVWDLRTHRLLHTVSALNQCRITFNSTGNIMFGVTHQSLDLMDDRFFQMFNSSFRTFDANDYQVITTVETKRPLLDLCTDDTDYYVAVIEANRESDRDDSNFCKIFEIGRKREADEEDEEQDQNDDEQDEDDFSSSNSSDSHFPSDSDDDLLFLHDGDDDDDDGNYDENEDEEENEENFEHYDTSSPSGMDDEDEDDDDDENEEDASADWNAEDDDENDGDNVLTED